MHYLSLTIDTLRKFRLETPSVRCGPEKISIEGNTEEVFEGVIFIKNHRRKEGCSASYGVDSNSTNPSYSIALDSIAQCGLELRRNVSSFRFSRIQRTGNIHRVRVQLSSEFRHSWRSFFRCTLYIPSTASDDRHQIQFYIVSSTISSGRVPNPSLQPARTVAIGEQLMYVWYLKADTEIYGIRVRDCFAETKDGQKMKIINNGCTTDSLIVSNVQYSENGLKAFADATAFKFPDAEDVWLTCSVSICIRHFEHLIANSEESLCETQPKCNEREKRSTEQEASAVSIYSIDDLVHHKLRVTDSPSYEAFPLKQQNSTSNGYTIFKPISVVNGDSATEAVQLCLQKGAFAGVSAALLSTYFVTICLAGAMGFSLYRSHHQKPTC
ncbi:unnamed protein product [Anisakis simplex]|uniref:ZP domain-containing protein n=1 Tax=Anisakis simplex TaxID=6269 RepID=A0A0M3K1W8_ANISI|nr:unnamed protein product [Anisakis simplex]